MSAAAVKQAIEKSLEAAEETCTTPTVFNYSNTLSGTGLTLHHILMILGGCFGIISVLIATYLLVGHIRFYTRAKEQQQQLRIIFFLVVLTVTSFLSLTYPDASGWIGPIGDYYESFAISALYLFYCQIIIAPDGASVQVTFAKVKHAIAAAQGESVSAKSNLGWVKRTWFVVLQIAVTRIITLVANEALYGATCPLSTARSHGSLAITVIQGVCTGFAVFGVIGFERRTRNLLKGYHPTFKLFSFKAVIGLQIIQEIVFTALTATKAFFPAPPYYISYNDFSRGFPDIMFLFEIMIVAILFLWSFSFHRYRMDVENGAVRKANPIMAFLGIFMPLDIFKALVSGFQSADKTSYISVEKEAGETSNAFVEHARETV